MKNIILLIASKNFQSKEYLDTKNALENSGYNVITASDKIGNTEAVGGFVTKASILVKDILVKDYDGLFIIGGPGALAHLDNEQVYKILNDFKNVGKSYGAICISPRILAKAGVLLSKKATGWDGDNNLSQIFAKYGVEYIKEDVVVDGNVVTANGPMSAQRFGEEISKLLK